MQHTTHVLSLSLRKAMALVLALALGLSLCPWPAQKAYGDEIADKQAEAEMVLANLNAMQGALDALSADYGDALFAQQEAEEARDAAKARIDEINVQLEKLQGRLSDRAREMYRSGNISFIDTLLGAKSFDEFATNLDLFNKVNENDATMVQERKELREEAQRQADIYDEQAALAAQKADEAAEAASQAEATVAEMQATYDGLTAEVAALLEQQRAAQAAAEAARAAEVVTASAHGSQTDNGAGASGAPSTVNPGSDSNGNSNSSSNSGSYDFSQDPVAPPPSYEGGSDAVSRAYACLGAPYVWGGVGPGGYDCSGLVSYCLTGSHTRLGTTGTFIGWPQVSDPQPGDVCVVHNGSSQHTGIYIGGGQMIHAATYGVGVIIGPVQSGMIIVRRP